MRVMLVSVASIKQHDDNDRHLPILPLWRRLVLRPEAGVFFVAVVVYLFFSLVASHTGFTARQGIAAWLNVAAELGIVALAVGLLMIAGEFDLSIGSVLGASSILLAIGTTRYDINIWLMIGIVLAFAAIIGLFNGVMTVYTKLPSFIITLATNFAVAGIALGTSRLITNTTSLSVTSTAGADFLFSARWGQANIAILWWLLLTFWGGFLLGQTQFGNWIFATGDNCSTAREAGVPVIRVKIILFIVTALAASLVGIIQTIEFSSGNASNGQSYVFQAPIVAVIGGVLLTGGHGSAFGIALGAALYGIISVGIFYTGWNADWVLLFLGLLLLVAVLMNSYFRRLSLSIR